MAGLRHCFTSINDEYGYIHISLQVYMRNSCILYVSFDKFISVMTPHQATDGSWSFVWKKLHNNWSVIRLRWGTGMWLGCWVRYSWRLDLMQRLARLKWSGSFTKLEGAMFWTLSKTMKFDDVHIYFLFFCKFMQFGSALLFSLLYLLFTDLFPPDSAKILLNS